MTQGSKASPALPVRKDRVFLAQFCMETNTFSDLPTDMSGFGEGTFLRWNASLVDPTGLGCVVRVLRDLAEQDGLEVVESLCAYPEPGGAIVQSVYEDIRDTLLDDLRSAGDVGMVLLVLHGAMVAEGYEDCEGDILRRVRDVVGPDVPVGIELDPHCHLSELMIGKADLVTVMRQYPHTDYVERAEDLYRLCRARRDGVIDPKPAVFDCRMVGLYPTTLEPMAGLVRDVEAAESEPGILSISLIHGFPWGDVPDTGTRVLVIADGDRALAERVAERLGIRLYGLRDDLLPEATSVAEAIARARELDGLVVLADAADNSGGGAPGDRTDLLRAILETGVESAFATIFDPEAVEACMMAGLGARLSLSIGGKLGPSSGRALDLDAKVMGLAPRHQQTVFDGVGLLGASAWIRSGMVDIVLASHRSQVFSPDALSGLGIDLSNKGIVAVKSMEHFRAGFAPMAKHIIRVMSDGALSLDFASLPYQRKRDLGYHPRVADPLHRTSK